MDLVKALDWFLCRRSTRNARAVLGAAVVALALASPAFSQTIQTIAGNAINDGRAAIETTLGKPQGLAFDQAGNLLIADRGNFVVRRVSAATGVSSVLAGGGSLFDDGVPISGRSAALDYPQFLAPDSNGDIYFSDFNRHRIRKITATGLVTTVAGTGTYGYSGDGGRATLAELAYPAGIALDRSGNLYVADSDNSVVRQINLATGMIQTVAGGGASGSSGDGGPATQARFNFVWALALDPAGNLYVSDLGENVVRRVSAAGVITTVVPKTAGLRYPRALAFDPSGVLHIADWGHDRVVRADPAGTLTVVAGGGFLLPTDNLPATTAFLFGPSAIAFDSVGNLFISEEGWDLVRRVDASSKLIKIVAGTLDVQDGGPALNAPLSYPTAVALDPNGNILVADLDHNRIRRIRAAVDPARSPIQTIAGTGLPDSSPDGTLASGNSVFAPLSLFVDASGNVYFTEAFSMVRKLDAGTGRLSTVAGTVYETGYAGDGGPATKAKLNIPFAAVADSAGNVYISDRDNDCIRRVDPAGIIRTVAGICTAGGYSGDGGPATQARMRHPSGLAFDRNGNLLISDTDNHVVRRLNVATGTIERVTGKGQVYGYSGDGGLPLDAELGTPFGLAVDRDGTLYIADDSNHVVRMIRGNTITTIAGVGLPGYAGDGSRAAFAFLNRPTSVAVDPAGNIYIVDYGNNRLRRVSGETQVPPVLSVEPAALSFTVARGAAPPAPQSLVIKNAGFGTLFWAAETSTSSGGPWLVLSHSRGSAPATVQAGINPAGLAVGTYLGTVLIRSTAAAGASASVSVSLTVEPARPPELELSTRFLSFDAIQGAAPPLSQILSINNAGSGDLSWRVQVLTARGNWLAVSQSSGTVSAGGPTATTIVSVNPEGLPPGLYLGLLTMFNRSANTATAVAVSLIVSAPASRILLHPSAFVFNVAQGSTFVPSQSFNIVNAGQGIMQWQVLSLLSQGDWLRVSPASGNSDAANPRNSPVVTLTVDPSGLSPGAYGGLLVISAAGARNNPQFATVVTRVLPQGAAAVPQVQPAGLLFTATTGGTPTVQEVGVQSTGGSLLTFTAGTRTEDGGNWLTVSPSSGALVSSTDRTRVRVQVAPGALAAGVYRGVVTFSFGDGSVTEVTVAAVLRAGAGVAAASGEKAQDGSCLPRRQVMVNTRLPNNFSLPTGWPVPMTLRINNDCGEPVVNSTVAASFNNGDPPLVMLNLQDGQYSGTWVPARVPAPAAPAVQVFLSSVNPQLPEATLELTGTLGLDTTNPILNNNGIVNGASFAAFQPVSPGSIFSLFGSNLTPPGNCFGGFCAESFPLPKSLGGVSVKFGGIDVPLFFAGPTQINGQVPVELAGLTSAAVVVTARGITSTQQEIQLDLAQPGIFKTGATQGAVLNQDNAPNSAANPAARGSVLQIYATGLGATNPAVSTGDPAPSSPSFAAVTNPVTLTVGGVSAVVEFQALAPGFVGLYQVNARIPTEVSPGSAVPVKIIQNGIESNEATVAIQ